MGPSDMGPASMGPVVHPSWLAATADRERTVGSLRAAFAEGRLTQDELGERVAQAYAARTYGDLWALTADLPVGPVPYPQFLPVPPGEAFSPEKQDATAASTWQSAAALLITALVIFTLAALVTAIVTAHAQTGMLTPAQQPPGVNLPYQVHLLPDITTQQHARS
jgi:hypothetical protein